MGVLRAEWRVHATALDDLNLIDASLDWLCDSKESVEWSKQKSFHGPVMNTGLVTLNRKKKAFECLRRLGREVHISLLEEGLDKRVDDEKNLHIRISLSGLVRGEVRLVNPEGRESSVKGKFKIESYPGSLVEDVITDLIYGMV
tara:strand:+ start:10305 stop:10736 length:432 start_codon:yes stop_codon:yes gene_type:complete